MPQHLEQALAELDLITRDELAACTNVYTLTDAGRRLLQRQAETFASLYEQPQPIVGGGQ